MQEAMAVASVTGAEYRLYEWVLRLPLWRDPVLARRLSFNFIGRGQLLIEWTAAPQSQRRMILTTHVDREGFILGPTAEPIDGGLRVEGAHCDWRQRGVERERKGSDVEIVASTFAGTPSTLRGSIAEVGRSLGGEENEKAVLIDVRCTDSQREQLMVNLADPEWLVTAHPQFAGPEGPEGYRADAKSGEVRGWALDNAVGVVAGLRVLETLIEEARAGHGSTPVNVSLLLTTGEEEGFTGILNLLRLEGRRFARAVDDLLWVVVDCSSCDKAWIFPFDEWHSSRLPAVRGAMEPDPARCPIEISIGIPWAEINEARIRVEDKGSLFDAGAARLLLQAQIAAQADGRRERPKFPGVGAFVGGFCEAGPLSHLPDLLRDFGGPACSPPRVGCIAVPIRNYRSIETGSAQQPHAALAAPAAAKEAVHKRPPEWRVGPEIAHLGAIGDAWRIALEAGRLHMSYAYPPPSASGYRGFDAYPKGSADPSKRAPAATRAALVKSWRDRAEKEVSPHLARLERWIEAVGRPLLAEIRASLASRASP